QPGRLVEQATGRRAIRTCSKTTTRCAITGQTRRASDYRRRTVMSGVLNAVFRPLFVGVVVVQGIHVFEHIVQLVQVFVLGITDTVLHFFYNLVAYSATVPAFIYYITRTRPAARLHVELATR